MLFFLAFRGSGLETADWSSEVWRLTTSATYDIGNNRT